MEVGAALAAGWTEEDASRGDGKHPGDLISIKGDKLRTNSKFPGDFNSNRVKQKPFSKAACAGGSKHIAI